MDGERPVVKEIETFASIVENEALTLHSFLMTSSPEGLMLKPGSIEMIDRIRKFRHEAGTEICFTLDAGANVHVLYPLAHKESCLQFIQAELVGYCQKEQYICDEIGEGTQMIVDC